MGQFLEFVLFVALGILLWRMAVRFMAFYRFTRPAREAYKTFRRAEKQSGRKEQPRAKNRQRQGKSFIREYAEDVEYVEIAETKTSTDGKQTTEQQTIVESQVTDVEWEEVKK